jgi:hypothetical protein
MFNDASSFDVKSCELRHFGPHRAISGRVVGLVRVRIEERFMGNLSAYNLDLKVKADAGNRPYNEVRSALLGHAAHQLNRLKARHSTPVAVAAE